MIWPFESNKTAFLAISAVLGLLKFVHVINFMIFNMMFLGMFKELAQNLALFFRIT